MTSEVHMSQYRERKVEDIVMSIKNMMAICTLQLGPMFLQTYNVHCFKWRKNCNGKTQNR